MSAFWGYVWLSICIVFGLGMWICNVLVIDNAYPQILDAIRMNFTHTLFPYERVLLFLKLVDYSPLFIWFMGLLGFIAECTIWGTSEEQV